MWEIQNEGKERQVARKEERKWYLCEEYQDKTLTCLLIAVMINKTEKAKERSRQTNINHRQKNIIL